MNILDESYFPYTGVDQREIPPTVIPYLYSRSNSDNLGFHPWKFSLCWPANTYQIVSSEATKSEIQHIKGTKKKNGVSPELPLCSVQASPPCWQLQGVRKATSRALVEAASREHFPRRTGMSTHNGNGSLRAEMQSQVYKWDPETLRHLRAGNARPRFKQMESASSVLERTDKHNKKECDACFLNFSSPSLPSHLFPKCYRNLMLQ